MAERNKAREKGNNLKFFIESQNKFFNKTFFGFDRYDVHVWSLLLSMKMVHTLWYKNNMFLIFNLIWFKKGISFILVRRKAFDAQVQDATYSWLTWKALLSCVDDK